MYQNDVFLKSTIEKYEAELVALNGKLLKKVSSQSLPTYVSHYTTDEGLRGILESGEFQLTNVFNLNDPSEIKFGVNRAIEILNSLAIKGSADQKIFANRFSQIYQQNIERAAHFFAFSFSKNSDELGQWRSYADDGRGYALEFKTNIVEDLFKHDKKVLPGVNSVFDVRYKNSEIIHLQKALVTNAFLLINLPVKRKATLSQKNSFLKQLSTILAMYVLNTSLFFKHEGYVSEEEYRFLQTFNYLKPVPNEQHRFRKDEIVRYRRFNWRAGEQLALRRVIIGPSANKVKATKFVNECLDLYGYKGVLVSHSEIPYRSQK